MESPALDQTWFSDEINVRAWKRTQLYEMYNNSETGLCVFEHTIMINVFLQKKRLTEFWRTARKSYFLHGDWNLHKSTREDAHIHAFLASRIFNLAKYLIYAFNLLAVSNTSAGFDNSLPSLLEPSCLPHSTVTCSALLNIMPPGSLIYLLFENKSANSLLPASVSASITCRPDVSTFSLSALHSTFTEHSCRTLSSAIEPPSSALLDPP